MSQCATHDSMHLPFPALLTKLFKHFCIVSDSNELEQLTTGFNMSVMSANNLDVIVSNELVFGDDH